MILVFLVTLIFFWSRCGTLAFYLGKVITTLAPDKEWSPCSLGLVWLISRTFSANEQYFSLIPNQTAIFSAMTYQPSEQVIVYVCLALPVVGVSACTLCCLCLLHCLHLCELNRWNKFLLHCLLNRIQCVLFVSLSLIVCTSPTPPQRQSVLLVDLKVFGSGIRTS